MVTLANLSLNEGFVFFFNILITNLNPISRKGKNCLHSKKKKKVFFIKKRKRGVEGKN